MTLTIQKEVPSIIIITVLLCILCVLMGKAIKKFAQKDVCAKPTGLAFLGLWLVDTIDGMVKDNMGQRNVEKFGPYIGSIAMYILVANLSGLFGFNTPTCNLSVTLALASITWILIEHYSLKSNKLGGYLHAFIEPMPFFLVGNVFGKFAPLLSLSLRLFGNILSGTIIMSLLYTATSSLLSLLLSKVGLTSVFNALGVVIAPIFHAYFDVFSGCIQMYIFISLTMALINNEMEEE